MKAFYECDKTMKRIPLVHSLLKVLTKPLSYILGTRETSLRVAKSPVKLKQKGSAPKGKRRFKKPIGVGSMNFTLILEEGLPGCRAVLHTA